jgi:hypothetical protein
LDSAGKIPAFVFRGGAFVVGIDPQGLFESLKVFILLALLMLSAVIILQQILKCVLQIYLGQVFGSMVASVIVFGLIFYALNFVLLAGLESITGGINMYSLSLSQVTGLLYGF